MKNLKYAHPQPAPKKSWLTTITVGSLILFIYLLCQLNAVPEVNAKTVLVSINGLTETYTTFSPTVGGLITELMIAETIITVTPPRSNKLTDQTQIAITTKPTLRNSTVAANMQATIQKVQEEIKKREAALAIPKSPIYEGYASWYAFGNGMNTASRQFPRGSKIRVIAVNSGKTIDVIVNDFGPEDWTGVSLDLNRPAFAKLAPLGAGIIPIRYYRI